MFDRMPRPLMFKEPECTSKLLNHFTENGGQYIGEAHYECIQWGSLSQVFTKLDNGTEISSDKILDALGIEFGHNGTVPVDDTIRRVLKTFTRSAKSSALHHWLPYR